MDHGEGSTKAISSLRDSIVLQDIFDLVERFLRRNLRADDSTNRCHVKTASDASKKLSLPVALFRQYM